MVFAMNKFTKLLQQIYSPKYLFWTNTVTGSLFLFAGDGLEQIIEKKFLQIDRQFDMKRNGKQCLFLCCFYGYFYTLLILFYI